MQVIYLPKKVNRSNIMTGSGARHTDELAPPVNTHNLSISDHLFGVKFDITWDDCTELIVCSVSSFKHTPICVLVEEFLYKLFNR